MSTSDQWRLNTPWVVSGISSSACSYRAATDQRVSSEPTSWSSDHILMGRSLTYHCSARLYDGETVIDAHWWKTVRGRRGPNKTGHSVYQNSSCFAQVKVCAGVQCPVSDVGVCSAVRHAAGMQSIRLAGVWPAQAEQKLIKMIGHWAIDSLQPADMWPMLDNLWTGEYIKMALTSVSRFLHGECLFKVL